MRYYQPNVVTKSALRALYMLRIVVSRVEYAYIVEDVEIGCQGVSSSHISAIVWDLDGIVERIKIDAIHNQRHLRRVLAASKVLGRV
jgi:hypothetical protein